MFGRKKEKDEKKRKNNQEKAAEVEERKNIFHFGEPLRAVVSSPLKPVQHAVQSLSKTDKNRSDIGVSSSGSGDWEPVSRTNGSGSVISAASTPSKADSRSGAFSTLSQGSSDFLNAVFVNPIKKATKEAKKLKFVTKKKSSLSEPNVKEQAASEAPAAGTNGTLFAVEPMEPDKQLNSMEVIISKQIKGVSVQDWYETCWSETKPFYRDFLTESGKYDVEVGAWTTEPVTNEWDGEDYQQTRTVTFRFDRAVGMTANVTHNHYCRMDEKKNRCVLSMKVQMKGIPFADSFHVQIRWIATQKEDGISVDVGLFVVFVKQVLVAGKIRSGTTKSTTEMQTDLFRRMKTACRGSSVRLSEPGLAIELRDEEEDDEDESINEDQTCGILVHDLFVQKPTALLSICFPFLAIVPEDEDDIGRMLKQVKKDVAMIKTLPSACRIIDGTEVSNARSSNDYVMAELGSAQKALDRILLKYVGGRPLPSLRSIKGIELPAEPSSGPMPFLDAITSHFPYNRRKKFMGSWAKAGPSEMDSQPDEDNKVAVKDVHVAPDETLKAMDVIIDQHIKNTSVKTLYEVCFSEGVQTDYDPFYGPWLESAGKFDVKVGDWIFATTGLTFTDDWNGEEYTQKRDVSYKMERSFLPGQAPAIAEVAVQQFCRREGDTKVVWISKVETSGIPFGDTFNVRIRWVATSAPDSSISVKVGLFVVFVKHSMLSGKIRAGTTKETTKQQVDLFRKIRGALGESVDSELISDTIVAVDAEIERQGPLQCLSAPLQTCVSGSRRLTNMYPSAMIEDNEDISKELKLVETKMRSIEPFLEDREELDADERLRYVFNQLEVVHESLDNVIVWHGDETRGRNMIGNASFTS